MENILLYKTFLYRALCTFILVPHLTLHAMELQVDQLTPELVKHIQAGNVADIHEILTMQTEDENDVARDTAKRMQLIQALEYAKEELDIQQKQRAKKKCDNCFARYKPVIVPSILVAYSVVNITLSVLSYCQLQHPPSNIDIASLSFNIIGSVFPGIAYTGYEAIKHVRSGLHDIHQKDKVARLKKSQVVLQLMHEAAVEQ